MPTPSDEVTDAGYVPFLNDKRGRLSDEDVTQNDAPVEWPLVNRRQSLPMPKMLDWATTLTRGVLSRRISFVDAMIDSSPHSHLVQKLVSTRDYRLRVPDPAAPLKHSNEELSSSPCKVRA